MQTKDTEFALDRKLPQSAIRYLLEHLSHHYSGPDLQKLLISDEKDARGISFLIPLSDQELDEENVVFIGELPVLFPCSGSTVWYTLTDGSIRFNHDILKSAFYLLSGMQEYLNHSADIHGRFPWKESIQYRLGFTRKPLVNYYFEIILDALEIYCKANKLEFKRIRMEEPVLLLSHDVDRIRKYSLRELIYVGLQLAGLKPSTRNFSKKWNTFLYYVKGFCLFKRDPFWNFEAMLASEKEKGIFSSWYFLEKTREDNSRYHFNDKKIAELIGRIEKQGHEPGIHGTLESSQDASAMKGGVERLNHITAEPISGIRQHFLKYSIRQTPQLQIDAGISYDTTLGFAEEIGFRNSYTFPFRLYNFKANKGMDLWQLPLHVMDTTLLEYMSVPVDSIPETVQALLDEVMRFNGVFSLLWHNSSLDEEEYKGVGAQYQLLLNHIMDAGFISQTGAQMISRWKKMRA